MAAPRERIALTIDPNEARRLSGLASFNHGRQVMRDLKDVAQRECPVDTGHMKRQHSVVYLGNGIWVLFVDTDYALFVHDGTRRNRANRWLSRALDIIVMRYQLGR